MPPFLIWALSHHFLVIFTSRVKVDFLILYWVLRICHEVLCYMFRGKIEPWTSIIGGSAFASIHPRYLSTKSPILNHQSFHSLSAVWGRVPSSLYSSSGKGYGQLLQSLRIESLSVLPGEVLAFLAASSVHFSFIKVEISLSLGLEAESESRKIGGRSARPDLPGSPVSWALAWDRRGRLSFLSRARVLWLIIYGGSEPELFIDPSSYTIVIFIIAFQATYQAEEEELKGLLPLKAHQGQLLVGLGWSSWTFTKGKSR